MKSFIKRLRRKARYNHKTNSMVLFLFVFILLFGVGFAYLNTTLSIEGVANVENSSWDIHFENVQISNGSIEATTPPTITDDTSVSFGVVLEKPGDYYEFTVDVVNDGTFDAKIDSISILPTLTIEQANYLAYVVTYEDGAPIQQNDALNSGSSETLLIHLEYLENDDTSLYPEEDQDFDFSVSIDYIQGTGNTISPPGVPTFSEGAIENGEKPITIRFSPRCGSTYVCKYQKDGGAEVIVDSYSVIVPFEAAGSIQASIDDGTNILSSEYTVKYNKIYVKSDGNDTTGHGSITEPYSTLTKAYSMSDPTTTIYVMDNITQTSKTTMNNNKTITLTSCTKENNTSCPTSTANTITRGNSLTTNIIHENQGKLILQDIKMDGNNIEADDPMIYVNSTGEVIINNGTLLTKAKNINDYGAAIGIYQEGKVTMNGGEISYNVSTDSGGAAVFLSSTGHGKFTLEDGLITHNTSHDAGAIWNGGTVKIKGGTISYNETNSSNGGAISNYGLLNITGGLFEYNHSANNGGAILNTYYRNANAVGTMNISGGIIRNNDAIYGGGIAIYSAEDFETTTTISGTVQIINNNCSGSGGGIYTEGTLKLNGGIISNNESTSAGGGIYLQNHADVEMKNGEISSNITHSTVGGGGGIYSEKAKLDVSGGSIINNISDGPGGGITYSTSATGTISGGTITGNTATDSGGGVIISGTSAVTIKGGTIDNNTSEAMRNYNVGFYQTASLIDNNSGFTSTNSTYKVVSAVNNNFAVDAKDGATANFTNIQLYTYSNANRMKWKILPAKVVNGTVYYWLESLVDTGKVIDIYGHCLEGSIASGHNVELFEYTLGAGTDQDFNWYLENAGSGYHYIKSQCLSLCFDLSGGTAANEQNLQVYTCNSTNAQKWKFVKL